MSDHPRPNRSESNDSSVPRGNLDVVPNGMRVKGINFITFLDAVNHVYGPAARQRLEKEATGEFRDALRFGGIVASGWYKIDLYRAMWRLFSQQLKLDDAGVRRLSQKATALGVNVVYRTLAKISSPTMLLSMGKRIFQYYFDHGRFDVLEHDKGTAVVEWSECDGFDSRIWNHVLGGGLYFLEVAGAKRVEFQVLKGGGNSNRMQVSFCYS